MLDEKASLPQAVVERLPGRVAVESHSESFNPRRWRSELGQRSLPVPEIFEASGEKSRISRNELMRLADATPTAERALDLLICSLAWGLGLRAPRMTARLDALGANHERASDCLMQAWRTVQVGEDVAAAYRILATEKGHARIPWLGAAFLTKFLYFAEGTQHRPRHLILDAVVAEKLRPFAWQNSPTTAWHPATYARYCALLNAWANEASDLFRRPVWPDEIEFTIFRRLPSESPRV